MRKDFIAFGGRVARTEPRPPADLSLTRRTWLTGSLIGGLGWVVRARDSKAAPAGQTAESIQAEARRAGLRAAFHTTESKHFLGIGDAPDKYRRRALEICQELSTTYLKHFHDKGFTAIALPEATLTVVTLKDRASYEKFLGEDAGPDVGGHFDLDANRLVIYDFRSPPNDPDPIANAERVNMFTLIHEGLHLLTFNTGLLNLKGDVPACVSEGLAAYGEAWRPGGHGPFGLRNGFRRDVLADPNATWTPIAKLISDDKLLTADDTAQFAYAQSWVFAHCLMKTPAKLKGFRAYLDAIRERKDSSKRQDDATKYLGDLDRLDRDLKKYAARLLEERP